MGLNVDGSGEALGNRVPLGTAVCSTCHIVLSVPFSLLLTLSLSLLISIPLARSGSLSRSVVCSLSFFLLPPSPLRCGGSLSLSFFLLSLFFSLARLLSFSLANRTYISLILSPNPPTPPLSFSLFHATVVDLSALRRCV